MFKLGFNADHYTFRAGYIEKEGHGADPKADGLAFPPVFVLVRVLNIY